MNPLERALRTEATLRDEIDAATAQADGLDRRRSELAFDAHTGNNKAKTDLAAVNKERVEVALTIQTLQAALLECGRRIEQAKSEGEAEAERERAREVAEIAKLNAGRGARIAEAARTLRDEIKRFEADLERMRLLGAPVTSGRIVTLALTRAISPLLRKAGLDLAIVPPGQRHDPQEIVYCYLRGGGAWADKVLDGDAANGEEAA